MGVNRILNWEFLKRRLWQASKPEISTCFLLNRLITQLFLAKEIDKKKKGEEIIWDSEMTVLFVTCELSIGSSSYENQLKS